MQRIKSTIRLRDQSGEDTNLKRLALLFDEIHFIPPAQSIVTDEYMDRLRALEATNSPIPPANPFVDTIEALSYEPKGFKTPGLADVVASFQEADFLHSANDELSGTPDYKLIVDLLGRQEASDPHFWQLSNTTRDQFAARIEKKNVRFFLEPGDLAIPTEVDPIPEHSVLVTAMHFVRLPNCIQDSLDLSRQLLLANALNAHPIFLEERHRKELEYRYLTSQEGLAIAKAAGVDILGADQRSKFGQTAFTIARTVFPDEILEGKSVGDIVRFRTEAEHLRHKFLWDDISELDQLINENPWAKTTERKVDMLITTRLNKHRILFEEQSVSIWEKLFGSLAVQGTQALKSGALGGGVGGLMGTIAQTSLWEFVALCALVGAAKEAPQLVRSIAGAVIERRQLARSSIMYLNKILK